MSRQPWYTPAGITTTSPSEIVRTWLPCSRNFARLLGPTATLTISASGEICSRSSTAVPVINVPEPDVT